MLHARATEKCELDAGHTRRWTKTYEDQTANIFFSGVSCAYKRTSALWLLTYGSFLTFKAIYTQTVYAVLCCRLGTRADVSLRVVAAGDENAPSRAE